MMYSNATLVLSKNSQKGVDKPMKPSYKTDRQTDRIGMPFFGLNGNKYFMPLKSVYSKQALKAFLI